VKAVPRALADYTARSTPILTAFLDAKARELPDVLHAPLREYILRGGKRLRGTLVLLGCEAGGGSRELAMPASLACELLHAYLLIHDDFMDRDELRRGGPTLHVTLARDRGEHLGGSVALLLGSLTQSWAHELLLSTKAPLPRLFEAERRFEAAIAEVTIGEMLDLEASRHEASAEEVLEIERRKTGGYTFELPLLLGAALAGAPEPVDAALRAYARPLGQAFQIADDLLGTFGSQEQTGKPVASDLREGKRTLLVIRALEKAAPRDAAVLRAALGKHDLTEAEANTAREVMIRTGAVDAARADAERLCDEALAALRESPLPAHVRDSLAEIATHAIKRAS
jgi:geranylgeranyl diphosphate synthase type I